MREKILLLGATGRTGKYILEYALAKGYEVVALARNPEKIELQSTDLTLVKGQPDNLEDIKKALVGCNAVVNALSIMRTSDNPWAKLTSPPNLISSAIRNCIKAMNEQDIKRIVTQSAIGAGDSWGKAGFILKAVVQLSNIKVSYKDHDLQEKLLKESFLDWTIVRPAGLTDKNELKDLIVSEEYQPKPGSFISRKHVGKFIIDCLEDKIYIHKAPIISEKK